MNDECACCVFADGERGVDHRASERTSRRRNIADFFEGENLVWDGEIGEDSAYSTVHGLGVMPEERTASVSKAIHYQKGNAPFL